MTEQAPPQYAAIEQPFGCEPVVLHCPICGTRTAEFGGVNPCPHLAFVYASEEQEFVYESDDFVRRRERLSAHQVQLQDVRALLAAAGYGNRLLAIEITYGGMACGPVWYTDVVGFDFDMLAADTSS